ncbi:MAG: DNA polymerase I [candidate division WOR-3 bacterium]|nr:DNA polymerase I [candidate division WOR-3 bacterium]
MNRKEEVYLLDGHSLVFRSYYAFIRNPLRNSRGENTSAIFGFVNTLRKILKERKPKYLACVFDSKAPTFRHKIYLEYKKIRPEAPSDLRYQIPVIKEICQAYGIKVIEISGYEADDVLCTLAKRLKNMGYKVYIVATDKDLFPIVDEDIIVYDTYREIFFDREKIKEKYGIEPEKIGDYLALVGDKIDNIPGVKGIGEKTAIEILKRYGNLEKALKEDIRLKGKEEEILFSKKLVNLREDVPIEFSIKDLEIKNKDNKKLLAIFKELGFKTFLSDFEEDKIDIEKSIKITNDISQLEIEDNFAFLITEEKVYIGNKKGIYEGSLTNLKELFLSNKEKITYDLKEQYKYLEDLELKNIFDIKIAAYLLEPERKRFLLEDLILSYLKILKKSVSPKEGVYYIYLLYQQLLPEILIRNLSDLFYNIEMPLIACLYRMEKRGIKIDIEFFRQLAKELEREIFSLQKEIYKLTGLVFNLNSPKQLAEVLFDKLKLPIPKGKGRSTASEVLLELLPYSPVIEKILRYRELNKILTTYLKPFPEMCDKNHRLHTYFDQTKTATGRLASLSPNLQNIPIRGELGQKIRAGFICEEGYQLISADYSQIELRVLAHITEDENLLNIFLEDKDIHTTTAAKIFKIKEEEVKDDMRRFAKIVNYGLIYGMSDYGLAESLRLKKEEAKEFMENYLNNFPRVKEWQKEVIEKAKEEGFTKTILGRPRYFPNLLAPNKTLYEQAKRQAINAPIQGSAADIIKKAMIEVDKKLRENNFNIGLILTIHDELLFEIEEERIEEAKEIIKKTMENVYPLKVPLKVNIGIGKNWALAHP